MWSEVDPSLENPSVHDCVCPGTHETEQTAGNLAGSQGEAVYLLTPPGGGGGSACRVGGEQVNLSGRWSAPVHTGCRARMKQAHGFCFPEPRPFPHCVQRKPGTKAKQTFV